MEDNADMNEIEEELITVERNRNPKVVLGFFSIIFNCCHRLGSNVVR